MIKVNVSEFNKTQKLYPFMDLKPGDVFLFSETVYMVLMFDASQRWHVLKLADVVDDDLIPRDQRSVCTWNCSDMNQRKVAIIRAELKLLSYE